MKYISVVLLLLLFSFGGYYLGSLNGVQTESVKESDDSLSQVDAIETRFDHQQELVNNRLNNIKNRVETIKVGLNEQGIDTSVSAIEIDDALNKLNSSLNTLESNNTIGSVPIPADSPSGRVQNQPRTPSGISVSVLENYERETGVSPQEIEELMRREH